MTQNKIKRSLTPLQMQGDQWRVIMLEMMNSSDRATIVTAAATLDALLAQLLRLLLIEEKCTDNLFTSGALKTFNAKITMSYCLGLISEDERADLETIQQLRNDFAHNWLEGSFRESPTSEACSGLRYAQKWKDELAQAGWSDSARERFIVALHKKSTLHCSNGFAVRCEARLSLAACLSFL